MILLLSAVVFWVDEFVSLEFSITCPLLSVERSIVIEQLISPLKHSKTDVYKRQMY